MDATIILNQRWQGQQVKTVTVWSNVVNDPVELQDFADNLRVEFVSSLVAGSLSETWFLDSITVRFNESSPVFSIDVPFSAGPLQGGSTGSDLPCQVALLVSTRHLGVPPNRGRMYFAGTVESHVNGGIYDASIRNTVKGLVDVMAAGIDANSTTFFLRIARRNSSGLIVSSNPVDQSTAQQIPATQRRRRLGVGA